MKLDNGDVYPAENVTLFPRIQAIVEHGLENIYNFEETVNSLNNIY